MENSPTSRQPASGNKVLVIVLVVFGVLCLGMVALGVVGFMSCRNVLQNTVMPMVSCGIAYEEVREAMFAYAKDHDGKLPNAATWEDDVRPYFAKVDLITKENADAPSGFRIRKMPVEGPWGCKIGPEEYTGMAFNKDLSGKKLADIKDAHSTVLLFEVEKSGKNLSEPYSPRSTMNAPKLFGESRGWMWIPVEGKNPFGSKGGKFGEPPPLTPPAPVEEKKPD